MKTREQLNYEFYTHYHNYDDNFKLLKQFVLSLKCDSVHFEPCMHFINRLIEMTAPVYYEGQYHKIDPNPFVLGMLCDAWSKLLDDIYKE